MRSGRLLVLRVLVSQGCLTGRCFLTECEEDGLVFAWLLLVQVRLSWSIQDFCWVCKSLLVRWVHTYHCLIHFVTCLVRLGWMEGHDWFFAGFRLVSFRWFACPNTGLFNSLQMATIPLAYGCSAHTSLLLISCTRCQRTCLRFINLRIICLWLVHLGLVCMRIIRSVEEVCLALIDWRVSRRRLGLLEWDPFVGDNGAIWGWLANL